MNLRTNHTLRTTFVTLFTLAMTLTVSGCVFSSDEDNGDTNSANNNGGGGSDGMLADQSLVARCQDSCDKQRFFDCYDAQAHAQCYDDCASADASSINKFNGCVENTTCDAQCSVHVQGKSSQVPDEDRVDTGREPEPNASSCEMACASMVEDMCVPSNCSQACTDADLAFQIVYCDQVRNGCDFPPACGGEVSPTEACKEGCQEMQFHDCLTASEAISCNQRCTDSATTDETRTLFVDCVDGASICDASCYKALDPDFEPGADVAGCQDACDRMNFFDCIDSTTLSSCRQLCSSATNASVESFKSCNQNVCEDTSCYDSFVAAN